MGPKAGDEFPDSEAEDSDDEGEQLDQPPWLNHSRERSILTKSDREFLTDDKDISKQAARNTRYRIRERIHNGFLDIVLLWSVLPKKDFQQIFERLSNNSLLSVVSSHTIGFLYEGITHVFDSPEDAEDGFLTSLESGIQTVERNNNGKIADIMFHIKRREPDFDTIYTKLLQERATLDEFSLYVRENGAGDLMEDLSNKDKGIVVKIDSQKVSLVSPEDVKKIIEDEPSED